MARVMERVTLRVPAVEKALLADEARGQGQELSDYVRAILESRRMATAHLLDGLAGRLEERLEVLVQAVMKLAGEAAPADTAETPSTTDRISVRLPVDLIRKLEAEALQHGKQPAAYIRQVILSRPRSSEPIEMRMGKIDQKLAVLAQGLKKILERQG